MKLFKRSYQIGFVLIMTLFFVQCSDGIVDDDGGGGGTGMGFLESATHTYDMTFIGNGETLHIKGSVTKPRALMTAVHFKEGGNQTIGHASGHEQIVIAIADIDRDEHAMAGGTFLFDKLGLPYPLVSADVLEETIGSTIIAGKGKKVFESISGKATFSKITHLEAPELKEVKATYPSFTMEFEGKFLYWHPDIPIDEEPQTYSGSGKIVIGSYKK